MWHYFTDPVLQAPTLGSMLMCLASSLVGVVAFIRRKSLLGEALSHACYPGVVLSVLAAALFFPHSEPGLAAAILAGAFISAWAGLKLIEMLEERFKVKNDAALCFILALFFGIGILVASRIQLTHALWYKQIQLFLFGQAATMTGIHVAIYGTLSFLVILSLFLFYRKIQIASFDRGFARSAGVGLKGLDQFLFILLAAAVVIGIRSVGVVLMSGMLIAPAVAARQYTHRLGMLFVLAGCFGIFSGFFGNYLSGEIPRLLNLQEKISLPTGPMILLTASFLCFFSLLFAPERGLLSRVIRVARFKNQCQLENGLKYLWKKEEKDVGASTLSPFLVQRLIYKGWIEKNQKLTPAGKKEAARIIRLHRLWEAYLVYLGQGVEKVHRSAEEMEHILTPALERELTDLLHNPTRDPHNQPIPRMTR